MDHKPKAPPLSNWQDALLWKIERDIDQLVESVYFAGLRDGMRTAAAIQRADQEDKQDGK